VRIVESYDPKSERQIFYEFDPELRLRRAFLSSEYRQEHIQKELAGALHHSWREDEAVLAQGLEYRRRKP
jgi:hypothetical protein